MLLYYKYGGTDTDDDIPPIIPKTMAENAVYELNDVLDTRSPTPNTINAANNLIDLQWSDEREFDLFRNWQNHPQETEPTPDSLIENPEISDEEIDDAIVNELTDLLSDSDSEIDSDDELLHNLIRRPSTPDSLKSEPDTLDLYVEKRFVKPMAIYDTIHKHMNLEDGFETLEDCHRYLQRSYPRLAEEFSIKSIERFKTKLSPYFKYDTPSKRNRLNKIDEWDDLIEQKFEIPQFAYTVAIKHLDESDPDYDTIEKCKNIIENKYPNHSNKLDSAIRTLKRLIDIETRKSTVKESSKKTRKRKRRGGMDDSRNQDSSLLFQWDDPMKEFLEERFDKNIFLYEIAELHMKQYEGYQTEYECLKLIREKYPDAPDNILDKFILKIVPYFKSKKPSVMNDFKDPKGWRNYIKREYSFPNISYRIAMNHIDKVPGYENIGVCEQIISEKYPNIVKDLNTAVIPRYVSQVKKIRNKGMISLKKKIKDQNKRRTVLKSKRSITPNTFDAAMALSEMMDIDDFEILNEDIDIPLPDSSLDPDPEIDLNHDLLNDMLEEYYDE
tara:strand:- start:5584 stop:7251 length:1668 start_codon:yes stop_codon:yes gene_type:complete